MEFPQLVHDLRGKLTVAKGFLDLAQRPGVSDERRAEFLGHVRQAVLDIEETLAEEAHQQG